MPEESTGNVRTLAETQLQGDLQKVSRSKPTAGQLTKGLSIKLAVRRRLVSPTSFETFRFLIKALPGLFQSSALLGTISN